MSVHVRVYFSALCASTPQFHTLPLLWRPLMRLDVSMTIRIHYASLLWVLKCFRISTCYNNHPSSPQLECKGNYLLFPTGIPGEVFAGFGEIIANPREETVNNNKNLLNASKSRRATNTSLLRGIMGQNPSHLFRYLCIWVRCETDWMGIVNFVAVASSLCHSDSPPCSYSPRTSLSSVSLCEFLSCLFCDLIIFFVSFFLVPSFEREHSS